MSKYTVKQALETVSQLLGNVVDHETEYHQRVKQKAEIQQEGSWEKEWTREDGEGEIFWYFFVAPQVIDWGRGEGEVASEEKSDDLDPASTAFQTAFDHGWSYHVTFWAPETSIVCYSYIYSYTL